MAFEYYVHSGGKRLRCGYTTGTCAALAASGAAVLLLTGNVPDSVSLRTPKGLVVEVGLDTCRMEGEAAVASVVKDAGDDIDVTAGLLIFARVEKTGSGIEIDGGEGVGRVTKPGLDQPVGRAAINSVPRRMIEEAVTEVCENCAYTGGLRITVFVPGGQEAALKTFNPHLGITGGISILGTSGIVEPMSRRALIETIAVELRQASAGGGGRLILTPGNYGLDYMAGQGWDKLGVPVVRCSNFIGEALDEAGLQGFREILMVGHAGKFFKLAGGIMNTHSHEADCRTELICAYAAVNGAGQEICRRIMDAATTDAAIAVLDEAGLRRCVLDSLSTAIDRHIKRRAAAGCQIEAVVFSNVYGLLGMTGGAEGILTRWKQYGNPA